MLKKVSTGPRSHFLRVKCDGCSSEQVIFGRPSTVVRCLNCNAVLAEPNGAAAGIAGKIVKMMD